MEDSDHEYPEPEQGVPAETPEMGTELPTFADDVTTPETGQVRVQEQDPESGQEILESYAEEEERGRKKSKREERERRKGKRRRAESKGKEKEKEKEVHIEQEDPLIPPPEVEQLAAGVRKRSKKSPSVLESVQGTAEPPEARPPTGPSIPKLRFPTPDLSRWKVHVDPKARTWAGLTILFAFLSCLVLYGAIVVFTHFNEFQPESRAELPVLVTLNAANVPKFKETILRELRPIGVQRDEPGQASAAASPHTGLDCMDLDGDCDDWAYRPQEEPEEYEVEPTGLVKPGDKPSPRPAGLESAYEGVNLNITSIPWHTAPITDEFTMVMQFVPGDTAADSKLKRRRVSVDALEALLQVQFAPVVANRRRQLFIKNNRLSASEESVMTANFEKDLNAYTQRIKREKKKALSQLDHLDPFTRNLARDDMANRQAQLEKKGTAQGSRCICNEMVGSISRFAFSCLSDEELANARDGAPQCRLFIDPELEPSWDLVTKEFYRVGCFQDPEWRATMEPLASALGIESQSDGSCPLYLRQNYHVRASYSEAPPAAEMFWFYGPQAYTALHLELHMHKEKVTFEKQRVSGSTLVWASKWVLNRLNGDQAGSRVRFQDRNAYRYNVIQQREQMKREVMSNASLLQEAERDKARFQERAPSVPDPPAGIVQVLGSAVRAAARPVEREAGITEPACLKKIGMQKHLNLDSLNQTAFYSETQKCIQEDFEPLHLTRKEEILSGQHAACLAQCYRANKVTATMILEARETNAASLRAIRAVLDELRGPNALRAIYARPAGAGKVGGR